MTHPRDVILRPVISEKSYSLIDEGAYTFIVKGDADKAEIREAVQKIWGVKVVAVNTMNRRGKSKRYRFTTGRTAGSKRAIVKLAPGDSIELFETR